MQIFLLLSLWIFSSVRLFRPFPFFLVINALTLTMSGFYRIDGRGWRAPPDKRDFLASEEYFSLPLCVLHNNKIIIKIQ